MTRSAWRSSVAVVAAERSSASSGSSGRRSLRITTSRTNSARSRSLERQLEVSQTVGRDGLGGRDISAAMRRAST